MPAAIARRHVLALTILASLALSPGPAAADGWLTQLTPDLGAWRQWAFGESQPTAAAAAGVPEVGAPAMDHAKSYGPGFPMLSPDARMPEVGMDDSVKQSAGCLISGVFGTSLALYAGAENLVNVIAGGVVASANPMVLYTGIFGVVFASFCAIGQALTPLYLHYVDNPDPEPAAAPRNLPPQQVAPPRVPAGRLYLINY